MSARISSRHGPRTAIKGQSLEAAEAGTTTRRSCQNGHQSMPCFERPAIMQDADVNVRLSYYRAALVTRCESPVFTAAIVEEEKRSRRRRSRCVVHCLVYQTDSHRKIEPPTYVIRPPKDQVFDGVGVRLAYGVSPTL